ncbi:glycine betaine/L-proline ABC transporter substrate-binding protein ProX [Neomesorhizobium albiziae]|nr:glycine betaine/L-proline ABC transporter substrate-binding protein ProX [Mesorhizobium albiziae]
MLAGCSDEEQTGTTKPYAQAEAKPGADVKVTAARANWDTGYFEAEIVSALLRELGYEVTPPAEREMSPDVFYPAVASRLVDFWANGWFPLHEAKLKTALPTRGIVGDLAGPVGRIVPDGALLGYLVDKPAADQHSIVSMSDLKRPEVAALFDRDANGKADLIGCSRGWVCAKFIDEQIEAQGWLVEQVQGDYATLFDDIVARVKQGQPVLYATWTPSYMVAELVPGKDVTWLQAPSPAGVDTKVAGVEGCASDPCETGFVASSIRIVANNEFLKQNPAAGRLLELVKINPRDIFDQNLKMRRGENTAADIERHAIQWIEANKAEVDRWLGEARSATTSN